MSNVTPKLACNTDKHRDSAGCDMGLEVTPYVTPYVAPYITYDVAPNHQAYPWYLFYSEKIIKSNFCIYARNITSVS